MYELQNRWRLDGKILRYYGLRNTPDMLKNRIKITSRQKCIIEKLPCELTKRDIRAVKKLIGVQIVRSEEKKTTPKSLDEARFCTECIANDYMIPGLEFDDMGRCPMCQTKEDTAGLKSIVPVMNEFPRCEKSRFDVALFYTGGKDSTYLLYYLSKVLRLRVLALTWEIPYMSESAIKSIEGAKKKLDSVEFITRRVSNNDLRKIYRCLYSMSANTCACPSLAYVLFYPELVVSKVPYFIAGNEPVQIVGLYYNGMAPKLAYSSADNKLLNFLINTGRVLTFRPPLKRGQFHTLATMKQLAYGDGAVKKLAGYKNELVDNIVKAIHEIPSMTEPLKRAIKSSSRTGNIPAFVQVDLNEISGGVYDWKSVKDTIIEECGWVAPDQSAKGLHTSCKIERCKENSQFRRFYNMESAMIPFSALEISLASRNSNISRETAMDELKNELGFSLEEIPECAIMKEYLEK